MSPYIGWVQACHRIFNNYIDKETIYVENVQLCYEVLIKQTNKRMLITFYF